MTVSEDTLDNVTLAYFCPLALSGCEKDDTGGEVYIHDLQKRSASSEVTPPELGGGEPIWCCSSRTRRGEVSLFLLLSNETFDLTDSGNVYEDAAGAARRGLGMI